MADGEGSGVVGDVLGNVGSTVLEELKKIGKTATAQVSGSQSKQGNANSASADQPAAQTIGGNTASGELKKIGKTALSQITGRAPAMVPPPDAKALEKNDKEFQEKTIPEIQAKIKQIYEEYEQARLKKEKQEELQVQQEEQKTQIEQVKRLEKEKKSENPLLNPAIAKTRAEIKNYGAE